MSLLNDVYLELSTFEQPNSLKKHQNREKKREIRLKCGYLSGIFLFLSEF